MEFVVTHLYDDPLDANTLRLKAITELLGIPQSELAVAALDVALEQPATSICLVTHAKTLYQWWQRHAEPDRALRQLQGKVRTLFIYGFEPEKNCFALASALSGGAITGIQRFEEQRNYDVTSSRPELTRQFSGLSFGPICRDHDFGFLCKSPAQLSQIISIAGLPFFASIESAGGATHLLGCNAVLDIEERTGSLGPEVAHCFSRLIPFAMFLKWKFGAKCWHNPNSCAAFIIDDPLLKETHGFLNYDDLLALMDANNFATTIAFIPWNYKRSRSAVARLFRQRSDRFSLSIHGCDHSQSEFATSDVGHLNYKVRLATSRMTDHREKTGVQHCKAMVFPRGEFSPEALKVLQANDYLAAVNTQALNKAGPEKDLRIRDFLDVAVTSYAGVSVFLRRYPGGLERFAFDLFWGKPALAVEHHKYLRDGGKQLTQFVTRLNTIDKLKWGGLEDVLKNSYMQRVMSSGTTACRFYSNTQIIRNDTSDSRVFTATKHRADDIPIAAVFVNGQSIDYMNASECVRMEFNVPPFSTAKIEILHRNIFHCAEPEHRLRAASQIFARRMLSEFRDNLARVATGLFSTTAGAVRD